jgi:uncharacterized protein YegP (UPF0339 family)
MKPARTLETYPDKGGRYRWRARALNGQITSASGQHFASRSNAIRAARREIKALAGAAVVHAEK